MIARSCLSFCLVATASTLFGQTISITPERPSGMYEPDETITWNVSVTEPAKLSNPSYTVKVGNVTTTASGALTLTNGKATISTSLKNPGWVYLEVTGKNPSNASVLASGGAVVAGDRIQRADVRPDDFDAFWDGKLAELAAVPMNAVETAGTSDRSDVKYSTVKLDCINGTKVQGQVARPVTGNKFPAMLISQWAGVYSLQKSWATWRASQGWLVLNTQAHDCTPIESDAYFQNLANTTLKDYAHIGNEDRETSYFLRMYLATYRAIEYLKSRPDWDGRVIVATGASQGGLQSLVAAGLHPDITAVIADVPAGCDQAGFDVGRQPGWPVWPWQAWDRDAAKVKQTARYYDVTNFAKRVRCPVLMATGLGDAVVPPSSVFTYYNELTSAKQIIVMPTADHSNNHTPLNAPQDAWLNDAKAGTVPTIKVAPTAAVVRPGGLVAFSVVATSGEAVGYQWLKDGVALPGAVHDHLVISGASEKDSGNYSVVVTGPGGSVQSAPASLMLDAGAPLPPTASLINLSTRAKVGNGTEQLIGGFVVRGSGAKRVLIRGVGPTLTHFSVENALADPKLTLTTADNQLIDANDNWNASPNADAIRAVVPSAGAFPLDEASKDAVLLLSLPPGNYTAIMNAAAGTTGVALLEIYDLEAGSSAHLVNLSSRGVVDSAYPMIAGFGVTGSGQKPLIARAVSPGLSVFGLSPLIAHPKMQLFNAQGTELGSNTGWESSADAELLPGLSDLVGASPKLLAGVADSALSAAPGAGTQTIVLSAQAPEEGVAIAEVYEVPQS